MGSSIADMFNVKDPEQAAKLALVLFAIGLGISIIAFALSVLCLAKEALCCAGTILKGARQCCECCVARCTGKPAPASSSSDSPDAGGSPSSPSAGSGRQNAGQLMSLVVMVVALLTALMWEFYFADGMDAQPGTADAWSVGCDDSMASYPQCLRYQAAYRVAFVTTLFFVVTTVATAVEPRWHNTGWDVKIFCFVALLVGLTFAPNPLFDGYVWVARVGAFVFLILQQVILIDSAYCVNEYLVERGYASAARPGTTDAWNAWLVACLALSFGLFAAALIGLVLLLVFYTGAGCHASNTFISLALILVVSFTSLQLFATPTAADGSQGHNFLASSVVAAYVVYLTFVAVSANPTPACNPTYSETDNLTALVLGLGITFLSISSTVYFSSKSMTGLVSGGSGGGAFGARPATTADLEQVLTGVASEGKAPDALRPSLTRQATGGGLGSGLDGGVGADGQAWKFNLVMALIACYWCCVLTDWGNPGGGASAASPTAGHTAMWMNVTASWICGLLYTWTLVAPLLLPDRDFSR